MMAFYFARGRDLEALGYRLLRFDALWTTHNFKKSAQYRCVETPLQGGIRTNFALSTVLLVQVRRAHRSAFLLARIDCELGGAAPRSANLFRCLTLSL